MIRYLIEFALRNRILVLSVAFVLFVWGIISFHNLPVEAIPTLPTPIPRSLRSGLDTLPRRLSSRSRSLSKSR